MTIRFPVLAALLMTAGTAFAEGPGAPDAIESDSGKYFDAEGTPTFSVKEDGTVDWFTYSGFRRYHSECHVCHGPDGMGSTYAPGLVESVATISYGDFLEVVVNGRENVSGTEQNVMPAFGTNPNVMCYIDDIYVYLRARAQGDLARGRPAKKEAKSDAVREAEDACMSAG